MILSDREIRILIARGRIGLDPVPNPDAWASTAVDLRLAGEYRRWKKIVPDPSTGHDRPRLRPGIPEYNINRVIAQNTDVFTATADNPLILEPGEFVLGWTVERLRLPHDSRVCARVEGKSSLARIGVGVHVTAPTVHAGFGGSTLDGRGLPIQLEIWNCGVLAVELTTDMRVCQLIFEEVHGTPDQGYQGQFSSQGPTNPSLPSTPKK